ncbi:MAG: HTH-type transcriptional activator IlvY [Proteobacteria bacterium]|nr:HTH-type transcriptional activator IlvY [Pseudomonadota bacterium]MBU1581462.1 HTH-type transcriptional activator IlvY [Pseudomonadota bacterium]MBU2454329.1 HTH-type transcriptional activator IlvY [Pseudomonadota bacterium]MBU2627327.1 HTH-type transcriptional activator IlvY [Pseudomonadota bacterium]
MDIRYLNLFRHLCGTLHFARTSQACYITPSALTRVIQRLESEIGEQLFIRDNRTVELTPAGTAFKKYADDVLQRWDLLQDELSFDDVLQGELSLYCSVTAAYGILPGIMELYRKAHPSVRIHLETGDAAKALLKLLNQDADMVIAALPDVLPKDLVFKPLSRTPLVFIAPRQYPDIVIPSPQGINWEKTPLIIPDHGLSRDRIDQWFAKENFIPNIYSQVAGNEAIIVMVSLGCGIGLIPRMVLEKSPFFNQVRILDNTPELPPFIIGLCTRKKNLANPRVMALWDIAGEK